VNKLKWDKKIAVVRSLVEGNSVRSTERITSVHRDTVMRVLVEVGTDCARMLDQRMRAIRCRSIEVDEIWTFVRKKQRVLRGDEKFDPTIGDQYVYVAFDPESKLVPCYFVGKRNGTSTVRFIADLQRRISGRIQITSDGFDCYPDAIERAWGSAVDYAKLVKIYEADHPGPGRYSPPRVTEAVSTVVQGRPDPDRVCTSYVERNNLTIRTMQRRFTRLALGFSKKLENLKAAVALHFAYYNFCWTPRTLRITPAMAAGLVESVWTVEKLLER